MAGDLRSDPLRLLQGRLALPEGEGHVARVASDAGGDAPCLRPSDRAKRRPRLRDRGLGPCQLRLQGGALTLELRQAFLPDPKLYPSALTLRTQDLSRWLLSVSRMTSTRSRSTTISSSSTPS